MILLGNWKSAFGRYGVLASSKLIEVCLYTFHPQSTLSLIFTLSVIVFARSFKLFSLVAIADVGILLEKKVNIKQNICWTYKMKYTGT